MAKFYGPSFNNLDNTETECKIITHKFIHSDGTFFFIVKPVDNEYINWVEQMNQVDPHQGMIENVEWKIKAKGNFKWTMDQMEHLANLAIVKEQITRKDRFGKKITLRNQECAVWDSIRGHQECGNNDKLLLYACSLMYINPDTRTFFGTEIKTK